MSDKRARGPMLPSEVASRTELSQAVLADLLARYAQHVAEGTLPRGPRGFVYDLGKVRSANGVLYVKKGGESAKRFRERYGPMATHFAYVEDVLGRARRADLIHDDDVADGRAVESLGGGGWDDAEEFAAGIVDDIESASKYFRLDAQRFQPVYLEVLCEAADLRQRVARVARPYGVPVYPSSGMGGIKGKREMGERAHARQVPTVVLQIGDRDDPGETIYLNAAEDSIAWAGDDGHVYPPNVPLADLLDDLDELPTLTFYRLALSPAQAEPLGILEGGKAEADAVPVPVLDGWVREAIEAVQDSAARIEYETAEGVERERLPDVIRDALDEVA
jgi:hypothetical protein